MKVTLNVITDIYSKPDKNGLQKLIKKNAISKKQFETTNILVEQFLDSKGIPSKKYCLIKEEENYFKLNHKFEEIEKLTGHIIVKGFKYENTKKL